MLTQFKAQLNTLTANINYYSKVFLEILQQDHLEKS
jgi:hypothetical protein